MRRGVLRLPHPFSEARRADGLHALHPFRTLHPFRSPRCLSTHSTPVPLATYELGVPPGAPTSRPPLVFLHGLLGSATNFRSIALSPALAAGRRVVTLDLRQHGASPWSEEPVTLEQLAGDVASTIAQLQLGDPPTVVGHSLGGKVAMTLALGHPGLMGTLIVLDISPVPYAFSNTTWTAVTRVVSAARALDLNAATTRRQVDAALAAAGVPDPGMRSFVMQNLQLKPPPGVGYTWRCNLAALQAGLPAMAGFARPPPATPCHPANAVLPAHIVHGDLSHYVLPEHHEVAKSFFPMVKLHTVRNAGHWLHADQPVATVKLLEELGG